MEPVLGIDFGTTYSAMAWCDEKGQARILRNAEGEEKTPSVVYFGESGAVVGKPALHMLEDAEESRRVVLSCKRHLHRNTVYALPGWQVTPVEVAAAILAKLKRDAEELHFHAPVRRGVITCPAAFGELERERIEQAARQAGFTEVKLLEEPVAAALAYARHGLQVGRHILVYDLGGGTFDLAVLLREGESGFRLALEPRGLTTCGGDDFDRALYDYLDERLRTRWDTLPIREFDPNRLMRCRDCKESLSYLPASTFSIYVGNRLFKEQVERQTFENLIQDRLEQTVRLTQDLVADAARRGQPVDTVVLIGGSARIPLVAARLAQVLPIQPHKSQHQDVAVALGAAHFAVETYEPEPPPLPPPTQAVNTVVVGRCAVNCVVFSPNGDRLASSGSVSGTIKLWEIPGGRELNILAGHTSDVLCLAFSSNGRWLASGSNDATVRLWEVAKNWISSALAGHGGWMNAVAFSPDGHWLASGNAYATVKLWEVARRRESYVLAGHRYSVRSVIFSPDGRWLASGSSDKTVKVWEAASGRELRALTGHGGAVNAVAFSPDGRWLASGSSDKTVKLWEAASGRELRALTGHGGAVNAVAFSPDGRWLASGSSDGTIKLWQ